MGIFSRFLLQLSRPSGQKNARLLRQRGETLDALIFRVATAEDIPRLAVLHVQTWIETYPTSARPPTYATREYQWRQQFSESNPNWFCFVIENPQGELIGFAKGLPYSSADLPGYTGELNKIYLLRDYQRLGLGRKLIKLIALQFLLRGIDSMVVFGVPRNPSLAFYERLGGQRLYDAKGKFHGGYGWKDLQCLTHD